MRTPLRRRTLVVLVTSVAGAAGMACDHQQPTGPSPPGVADTLAAGLALAPEVADRVRLNLEDARVRLLPGVSSPAHRARLDAAIRALETAIAGGRRGEARTLVEAVSTDVTALRASLGADAGMDSELDAIALALAYVATQL